MPKLGVLVDLVELDEVGVTFKTVEAFLFLNQRGAEHKGPWGRGSWP